MLLRLGFTFFILFPLIGLSQDTSDGSNFSGSLVLDKNVSKSSFSMGSDFVNMTGDGGSAMGLGLKAGFEYGLTEKFSIGSNIMFSFQMTGKPGALFYSGINGLARYTYSGVNFAETTTIKKREGVVYVKSSPTVTQRSTVFAGFDQLFLNGTANIYPAIGITLGTSRGFVLFDKIIELDFRYSMLQANDNPLSLMSFGASFNLDL